jgi:hypothetical protein
MCSTTPASHIPATEITHHAAALTIRETIELAYGVLWNAETDMTTAEGRAISTSRKALLAQLDRDGQAWGIYLAQLAEGHLRSESRRKPGSLRRRPARPLRRRGF